MTNVRILTRQASALLDVDIDNEYNERGRVSSSELIVKLQKEERYKAIIEEVAPLVVYSWFANLVRDRMQKAKGDPASAQLSLDLPGWDNLNLRGAYCTREDKDNIVYVRLGDMVAEDFAQADALLTRQIDNDTRSRRALRIQNSRLEPLREKYGNLPVRILIKRAKADQPKPPEATTEEGQEPE